VTRIPSDWRVSRRGSAARRTMCVAYPADRSVRRHPHRHVGASTSRSDRLTHRSAAGELRFRVGDRSRTTRCWRPATQRAGFAHSARRLRRGWLRSDECGCAYVRICRMPPGQVSASGPKRSAGAGQTRAGCRAASRLAAVYIDSLIATCVFRSNDSMAVLVYLLHHSIVSGTQYLKQAETRTTANSIRSTIDHRHHFFVVART
jgi:hypothetical protein